MKRFIILLSILAGFIIYWGCDSRRPSNLPVCDITEAFDSLLTGLFSDDGPGGIVMVVRNGDIVYNRSFGCADLASERPFTDTTLTNICAASKLYTVIGLLKLKEEGLVTLDTPITVYNENLPEIFNKVTVRNILSHTSGIPDLRPSSSAAWRMYSDSIRSMFTTARDYRLYAHSNEIVKIFDMVDTLLWAPGTRFKYEDLPYLLLMPIFEKGTGMSFQKWMSDNILKPYGLKDTRYFDPATGFTDRMAHAYRPLHGNSDTGRKKKYETSEGTWMEYDYGEADFFSTKPDKGIFTTALDFVRLQRLLQNGEILSPESLAELRATQIATDVPAINYGMGAFIQERPGEPRKFFHSTNNGGFSVLECTYEGKDLSYLIFSNRPDWERMTISKKIDNIFQQYNWI